MNTQFNFQVVYFLFWVAGEGGQGGVENTQYFQLSIAYINKLWKYQI